MKSGHAPVHRRTEQRHAAGGVVEGREASKLLEELDIRRLARPARPIRGTYIGGLVEELRLRIDLAAERRT